MTNEYKSLYKLTDTLRFKFRDYVDQPNDPVAVELHRGVDQLAEAVEMSKNPHTLEDLAKRLIEELHHIASQPLTIMDLRHLTDLREQLEHIRDNIHRLSNY